MEKLHVLIIEDDRDTAGLFSTVLSLVGFECETVLTAKEALARLAAGIPDLILLDLRLGFEITGEDILYQIRSNPRLDNTRVIVITAYPRMAEPVSNLADLILLKPVEVQQLGTLAKRLGSFEVKSKTMFFRDPVTELFNQEFFFTRLDLAFERTRRRKDFLFAVVVFHLKLQLPQDDTADPDVVIGVLREVSRRLKEHLRPTDTVARSGGWKFAALLEDLKSAEDVDVVISRLQAKLSLPYLVEEATYNLSACFGAALSGPQYRQAKSIQAAAEEALEQARSGADGNVRVVVAAPQELNAGALQFFEPHVDIE